MGINEVVEPWVIERASGEARAADASGSTNRDLLGGKASSLWNLSGWVDSVPDFTCLTVPALTRVLTESNLHDVANWLDKPSMPPPFDAGEVIAAINSCAIPSEFEQAIDDFLSKHPKSFFAVRSSGTLEDNDDASFAGLYRTVLNVKNKSDVYDAVRQCWASLFDERVLVYIAKQRQYKPMGLAVIIQVMVPAEKSGVLFTVNPVSGADTEILIEACFGLGELLVSGHVTPDRYLYDWFQESVNGEEIADKDSQCIGIDEAPFTKVVQLSTEQSRAAVLNRQEVRELVVLSLKIARQSHRPVDIEWAKVKDTFYILQSRPITQIGYSSIAGEWTTADLRDGGISSTACTPIMASLYKYVMDITMTNYSRRLGLQSRKSQIVWLRNFFCRPYWNLMATKQLLVKVPGFRERSFDEGLGIVPRYTGDGMVSKTNIGTLFTGLRALVALYISSGKVLKNSPKFSQRQRQRLAYLRELDLEAMNNEALFSFCETFLNREYFDSESTYFYCIYDNANINTQFRSLLASISFDMNELPTLLGGLKQVSHMAQVEGLWEMRREITSSEETLVYWRNTKAADIASHYRSGDMTNKLDKLKLYLQRYGHHSKSELDLRVPRYIEDPEYVITQIKNVLQQNESDDPGIKSAAQQRLADVARENLKRTSPFWLRYYILRSLRKIRRFLWWREELRDLSTQYYCYVRKVLLEIEQRLLKSGYLQKPGDIFFLDKDSLLRVLKRELSVDECLQLIDKNKLYFDCFSGFDIPDEIGQRYEISSVEASTDGALSVGVAGSAGVITGIARVVVDIDDAHRLQQGDILVTRCTDPGWTPKFSILSGVVTETGGILSHAAVICREYGIPAVLAVKKATSLIKDGMTITIDGNSGSIYVPDVAPTSKTG